jgi:hypothetical protein
MAPRKPAKKIHEPGKKTVTTIINSDEKKEPSNGTADSLSIDSKKNFVDDDIFLFFRQNANILATIGLIGTMISLMPSFVEKLSNDVWLGTLSGLQIACLFTSIITGITFIFLLFLVIWDQYFEGQFKLPFAILLVFFSLFLIFFEIFIYLAIQKYLYVGYILFITYVILAIFIIIGRKNETKRAKKFSMCLILFLLSLIIINVAVVTIDYFSVVIPDSTNTRIQTDVNYYSPLIPQTYGIGFMPGMDKKISFKGYNVNWTADYGYFFYIDSTIDRIKYLGNATTNHGELVYWTYDKEKIGAIKPVVNISMFVTDQSNKPLVSTVAHINWSSVDMAQV